MLDHLLAIRRSHSCCSIVEWERQIKCGKANLNFEFMLFHACCIYQFAFFYFNLYRQNHCNANEHSVPWDRCYIVMYFPSLSHICMHFRLFTLNIESQRHLNLENRCRKDCRINHFHNLMIKLGQLITIYVLIVISQL